MENRGRKLPSYVFSKALSVDESSREDARTKRYSFTSASSFRVSLDEEVELPRQSGFFKSLENALDANDDKDPTSLPGPKLPAKKDYHQEFEQFKARRAFLLHGVKAPTTEDKKEKRQWTIGKPPPQAVEPSRRYSTGSNFYDAAVLARQKAARKGPPPPPPAKKRSTSGLATTLPTVPDESTGGTRVVDGEKPETEKSVLKEGKAGETIDIEKSLVQNSFDKPAVNDGNKNGINTIENNVREPSDLQNKPIEEENEVKESANDNARFVSTTTTTTSDNSNQEAVISVEGEDISKLEGQVALESFPAVCEETENTDKTTAVKKDDSIHEIPAPDVFEKQAEIEQEVAKSEQLEPAEENTSGTESQTAPVESELSNEDAVSEEVKPEENGAAEKQEPCQAVLENFPQITDKPSEADEQTVCEETPPEGKSIDQIESEAAPESSPAPATVEQGAHADATDQQDLKEDKPEQNVPADSETNLQDHVESTKPEQSEESTSAETATAVQSSPDTEEDETKGEPAKDLEQPKDTIVVESSVQIESEAGLESSPDFNADLKQDEVSEPEKNSAKPLKPVNEPIPETDAVSGKLEAELEPTSAIESEVKHTGARTGATQEVINNGECDDISSTGVQSEVNQELSTEETKLQEDFEPRIEPEIQGKAPETDGTHLQSVVRELSDTISSIEHTLNGSHASFQSDLGQAKIGDDDKKNNVETELSLPEQQNAPESSCQEETQSILETNGGNDRVIDGELELKDVEKLTIESGDQKVNENVSEDKSATKDEITSEIADLSLHAQPPAEEAIESSPSTVETTMNAQTTDEQQVVQTPQQIINTQTKQDDENVFENSQPNEDSVVENSNQGDPKTTENSQQVKEESSEEDTDEPKTNDARRKLSKMAERLRSFSEEFDINVEDDELSTVEKDLKSINKCLDDMSNGFNGGTPETEELDKQKQIENLRREMEEMS